MKPEQLWDAELLNSLANEPENLERFGYASIDLTPFFSRPGNVALGDDRGAALFAYHGDGEWEGHYLFRPATPGEEKLRIAREMIDTMFTSFSASVILGQVPDDSRPARLFTRALGFTPVGTSVNADGRSCVDYKLERSAWAELSAES